MGDTHEPASRPGGLAAWAPTHVPQRGADLTPSQELAAALRHLDDTGFCENLSGHITWQLPGEPTLLANPWGYWWAEVTAGDIVRLDADGQVIDGQWDVTPAIHIHTELHRVRPDARVVVHSHPPHAAVQAAIGELPGIVHQNASILADEMVLVDDYDGEVDSPVLGEDLARRIGDASVALLVSHGVIVTAPTMAEAVYKSVLFERTCWIHHQVRVRSEKALEISPVFQRQLKASLIERAAPVYWDGALRQLLATEPEVLA